MRSGACFAHPTWEPPTVESACSSLLPTPAAQEPGGTLEQYHARLRKADGREPTFAPLSMTVQLLPPPRTSDTNGAGTHGDGGPDLRTAIALMPTPRVAASRTGRSAVTISSSAPSIEQAIEIAQGRLPREFATWDELPASWHGDRTSPLSDDGRLSLDDPPPRPPMTADD
jgi:hypothetical protein